MKLGEILLIKTDGNTLCKKRIGEIDHAWFPFWGKGSFINEGAGIKDFVTKNS